MNSFIRKSAVGAAIALIPTTTFAADAISGGVKQPLNITAIVIFFLFVLATLAITYWAAKQEPFSERLLHRRGRHYRLSERGSKPR